MGFLSFLQDQKDPHIRKDTILMPDVSTIEELEGIPKELHDLQGQGPIPDRRGSDQIKRTC